MCAVRNDPAFIFSKPQTSGSKNNQKGTVPRTPGIHTRKTEVTDCPRTNSNRCPYHKANHSIHECNGFRAKSLTERKKLSSE